MTQAIRDVMTREPEVLDAEATVRQAAVAMKQRQVGDVLVRRDGKLCGIVTDRDLVVRGLAEKADPDRSQLGGLCSKELQTLGPEDSIEEAIRLMREKALRRIPVVDGTGKPVGIVSLGDLAQARDPDSVLGRISAAPPSG